MSQKVERNSYKYEEIMKYQEINNVLPAHLAPYCVPECANTLPQIKSYEEQLIEIINSITKGDNPNDIIFRNMVKFYINAVNQNNYHDYLQKLKNLDYSSKSNIHFLATELLRCSLSCPISYKGFNLQEESKHKYVPEVCADIAKQFSSFIVRIHDVDVSFHNEMLAVCQRFFIDFMDINKTMDEHNTYNSDNYKGFMTFMGLLYSRSIVPNKIVTECMNMILKTIFMSSKTNSDKFICHRSSVECNNYYKGYEHLLNHVMHTLTTKIPEMIKNYKEKDIICNGLAKLTTHVRKCADDNKQLIKDKQLFNDVSAIITKYLTQQPLKIVLTQDEQKDLFDDELNTVLTSLDDLHKVIGKDNKFFNSIVLRLLEQENASTQALLSTSQNNIERVCILLNTIVTYHQEIFTLNSKFKTLDSRNQLVSPLKTHIMLMHGMLGQNLNKLQESLNAYHTSDPVLYVGVSA